MKLVSPAFINRESIPEKYTCNGEDISPPLRLEDVPVNAKSLALTVNDPDAPRGDFVHWVVWNIDPQLHEIAENTVPKGLNNQPASQGVTDFGKNGWGGPCPPSGSHRYYFKLYALDAVLDLPNTTTKDDLEKAMEGHVVDQAELMGVYQKS